MRFEYDKLNENYSIFMKYGGGWICKLNGQSGVKSQHPSDVSSCIWVKTADEEESKKEPVCLMPGLIAPSPALR